MTVSTAIDRAFLGALAPFDAPHNRFLRRFGRLLKPLIARRESRVVALGGNEAVFRLGGLAPPDSGLDVESLSWGLAPPWIGPDWTLRLLLLFAFAQAVHYAVWTRLIPGDARPRPGLRSFAGSYRALVADCGRPLVIVAFLIAGGLIAWALFDLAVARATYLRLALFHGPMELAVILPWSLEGRAAIVGGTAA